MEQELLNKEKLLLIEKIIEINKDIEEVNIDLKQVTKSLEETFIINHEMIEKQKLEKIDKMLTYTSTEIKSNLIPKIKEQV